MQDLLVSLFGTFGATAVRYVVAFAAVLALLAALQWALRRYMRAPGVGASKGRQPRLSVMDVAAVDARRRLVLVRRDNVEHLILIGGPTDIVVEQTIVRGVPVGSMGKMPGRMAAGAAAELVAAADPAMQAAPPVAANTAAAPEARTPEPLKPVAPERVSPAQALPEKDAEIHAIPAPRPHSDLRPMRPAISPVQPSDTAPSVTNEPYVPPAASRPEPMAEAIDPIVPGARAAIPVESAPVKPAASTGDAPRIDIGATDDESEFDDLARRLDEALRLDLAERVVPAPTTVTPIVQNRPTRGPAAKPAEAAPVVQSKPAFNSPPQRASGSAPSQIPFPAPSSVSASPLPPPVLAAQSAPAVNMAAIAVPTPAPRITSPEKTALPPRVVTATPRSVPAPVATSITTPEPAEPEAEDSRKASLGTASTWFRPRTPGKYDPAPSAEPPRAATPEGDRARPAATTARTQPANDLPGRDNPSERERPARAEASANRSAPAANVRPETVSRSADLSATLADDLARILETEPLEVAPERRTDPTFGRLPEARPVKAAAMDVEAMRKAGAADTNVPARDSGFSSLEDEMARLLDELAGDGKTRR
jgi:flagellar protein FliO/FliZ